MHHKEIKTRFAPSPTGPLHIGGARTTLFNYVFAKQKSGKFILRIEDTDVERSKKEYEEDIIECLRWLRMEWDEFYRQSERKEIYQKYITLLLEKGSAYISKESGGERESVIRFKNPKKKVVFEDEIRGRIEFETEELGDFVIAKDEKTPLYHLAVVVDDFEMGVSHIIRGEDHISNTPRQILIQEAIGAPRPVYAHLPLILGPDRSKLSKRHGAASVNEFRKMGYLPQALVNFLALLGWHPKDDTKEIFSIQEMIEEFSLSRIQKGGAVFNLEKLNWLNRQYIKNMPLERLREMALPYIAEHYPSAASEDEEKIKKILAIKQERMNTLAEAGEGLDYFFAQPKYSKELLLWKEEKSFSNVKEHLQKLIELLSGLRAENFVSHNIKEAVKDYAEEKGRGCVLWPFRVALTGLEKSPDPFSVAEILGRDETIKRLKFAIDLL